MRRLLLAAAIALAFAGSAHAQTPTPICAPQANSGGCGVYGPQINSAGALVSSKVLKAQSGILLGFSLSIIGATASTDYYVMVVDAAAAPSGAVAPSHVYVLTTDASGNATIGVLWAPGTYEKYTKGITVGLSSTCCTTFTGVADAVISGNVN